MKQNRIEARRIISITLSLLMAFAPIALAEEKTADNSTQISTTAVPAAASPDETQKSGNEELLNAISALNYKIEYLQGSYNRLNTDMENLKTADRDQKKMFNDRLSAMSVPDMSKIDSVETESALMRSEISQIRADIAEIKGKIDYNRQTSENSEKKEDLLHSPWIAVAALGLAFIAVVKN